MKYTTIAVLSLNAGVALGLSKSQAAPRATVLAPIADRDDWYVTTGLVQFKRGETFLCDDALPKSLADAFECEGKSKTDVQPRQKAKAKSPHTLGQPD